jgi:hypothetical protein
MEQRWPAGDETFLTLPYSKIAINFSHVYWESGWPYDARWSIAPDIDTPQTFAQYLAGDDPAMDAVLMPGTGVPVFGDAP